MSMRTRTTWIICQQLGDRPADSDPIIHTCRDQFESQKMLSVLKKAEEYGGAKVYPLMRRT